MDPAVLKGDGNENYRIVIWGISGAGKSTLARRLSRILPQLEVIDMDALFWKDNWVKTPPDEFKANLTRLTSTNESWITDSNMLSRQEAFLPRATDIIWLDFPLYVTLWRLLKRTVWRWWTQEQLFGTNCREDLRRTLFSKESIIWWCLTQHQPLRQKLTAVLASNEFNARDHLRRRFTSPAQVEQWVEAVEVGAKAR